MGHNIYTPKIPWPEDLAYAAHLRKNNADLWQLNQKMMADFDKILNHTNSMPKPRGSVLLEIHKLATHGKTLGKRFTEVGYTEVEKAREDGS